MNAITANIRTLTFLFTTVLLSLFIFGCKGPEGPVGPQGPAGPGSRQVYTGTVTTAATTGTGQVISIPDLNLADFPLVAVYVSDSGGDWVQLNLTVYNGGTATYDLFEVAILHSGSVTIFSGMVGQPYRIVVVY